MKRRNKKYQFKWWHGALGLVGLSMVLGTVRAVAADRRNGPPTASGSYRNYIIELQGALGGWSWRVVDQFGEEVGRGDAETSAAAYSAAQNYVDWYVDGALARNRGVIAEPLKWMHPEQRRTLQGAVGYGPPTTGRRALLATTPWDDSDSWQQQWDRFTR